MKMAVVKTGGKQYLVKENDEIYVDRLSHAVDDEIALETLLSGDFENAKIEVGMPLISSQVKAKVVENVKGEKIHILRFKAKVRHRKRQGFRPYLTKLKIVKI